MNNSTVIALETNAVQSHQEVGRVLRIPVSKVRRFARQPRRHFAPEKISALAESISSDIGQERPCSVRRLEVPDEQGCEYELIDGECRLLAAIAARVEFIEVIIKHPKNFLEQFKMSIVANSNQTPTSVLEDIESMRVLQEEKVPVKEIAVIFGKNLLTTYSYLRLLELDPKVLRLMGPEISEDKRLSLGAAKALLDLPKDMQLAPAEMICEAGMSTVAAQHMIKNIMAVKGIRLKVAPKDEFRAEMGRFKRIRELAALFVDQPQSRLIRTILHRSQKDLDRLQQAIVEAREDMDTALGVLNRLRVQRKR